MTTDSMDLAEADFSPPLSQALAARAPQYQDVAPEEVLDLLEEAAETYTSLAPRLPQGLRNIARREIKFFLSCYAVSVLLNYHAQQ